MTGTGDHSRARAALVACCCGLLALSLPLLPLLHAPAGGGLDVTTALVVCAVAATLALVGIHAAAGRLPLPRLRHRASTHAPTPSSRIPDPVRHPVSPRAPGLV